MSCPSRQEILEAVNAAADPESVQAHLDSCEECRSLYAGMTGAADVLSTTAYTQHAGTCLQVPLLAAYARRAVPEAQEAGVESHLAACARCREDLVALVETLEEEIPEAPVPLASRIAALVPACPSREALFEAAHGMGDASGAEAHAKACAPCRTALAGFKAAAVVFARAPFGTPAGPCLQEVVLGSYARRHLPAARESEVETHLASCSKCREDLVALVGALDTQPIEVPESLRRRVALLAEGRRMSASGRIRHVTGAFKIVKRRKPAVLPWVAASAAAALLMILLVAVGGGSDPGPTVKVKKSDPAKAVVVREEKPNPAPLPPKEEPKVVRETPPLKVEAKPLPPMEVPKPVAKIEQPKPSDPVPPREEPKLVVKVEQPTFVEPKPAPKPPARYLAISVTGVTGVVSRKAAAGIERLAKGAQLARGEEVFTDHRHVASFSADGGFAVTFEKGTSCQVEQQEGGETRVALQKGKAFFTVEKRPLPFVVSTPAADVIVVGTAFMVEMDEKSTALHVLEGSVRFQNARGEILVSAGHRSAARLGSKPAAPVKTDVGTEVAWTRRPDLVGDPRADIWIEHVQGGSRKYPGLVVAHPYYEGEPDSGRVARTLSETLDAGMILGHNHRNMGLKIWMNVDRGMECEVRDDGTRGPLQVTPRMKKFTEEYIDHMKAAAGLGSKQAVPMVVCLREQTYTAKGGGPLDVCEVACIGFPRRTIEQLKVLYGQLLDRHKPAYRMEMRFEGIDDRYLLRGIEQTFRFTESDAEADGYLATRHAQSGVTFFLTSDFGNEKTDFEIYNKILAEMVDFLWSSRRR